MSLIFSSIVFCFISLHEATLICSSLKFNTAKTANANLDNLYISKTRRKNVIDLKFSQATFVLVIFTFLK